jgi:predicted nucleotidyltransferase
MEQKMQKETIINYLISHKKEFQKKYEVEKIGLFGSYARDEATKDSDIDIFVQMKPDFFKLVGLKQQIEEDFDIKVDIVRLREKMNMALKRRILKDGINV